MIHVIATLRIMPGSLDAVVAAATPCITATREEAGCRRYDLLVDVLDDTRVTFVEAWESRAALEAHFASLHIAEWRAGLAPYLASASIEIIHPERVETL